ncbi:zinc finger Y-chromosomal protein 1-like [Mercenaria mercenaria]|uniref:zinc finger Y-chromosomal protein 1-like n=1 Tax=Mercenaria mercenaria TaxID=6596 RepID=UPI00234E3ED8|nr:zinc finger Y-chromosomal protein 1-like [Mercenaria mercenaria]XP_053378427.1 zinc finger Y-chromosomal protein 1-like [Mercenaria mercenaria]
MSQYSLVDDSSTALAMLPQDDRPTNPASTSTSASILEKKTDFNILEKLKYLRDNKKFCDVILEVRGVQFVAHKNVLASWSPVLGSKLYSDDPKVYKDHIIVYYDNSEVFSDLLDFMYNGYVAPRETNFLQLLHLAVSFQIETLKNYCEEFLRCNLHLGNFVSTYFLSRKFKLETLEEYIVGFLQLNLSDAVKQGEFLSLKAEKFNTFLSEGWMKKIKPEIKLFLIISWVGYDVQEREKYLVVLLGHIDWSTVANDFLLEINRTENFFTTHESSLYLLLQTLFSAGIPLGPYKEVFPQLRQNHSAILKEVVHTNLLKVDTEQFNPVTISVKFRPFLKDSAINTDTSQLPCNLKETAVNTDVNSLHFEESEKEVQPVEEQSTLIEEQPVVSESSKYEQFETLGDFIEAEIHEINQKEKERLILKEHQEEITETLVDLKEEKTPKKTDKKTTRRSSRQTSRKKATGFYKDFNDENDFESSAVKRDSEEFEVEESSEKIVQKVEAEVFEVETKAKFEEEEITSEESEESLSEDDDEENEGKKKIERSRVKGRQSGRGLKRGKRKRASDANVKVMGCKYDDCAYMTKFPTRMEKHIKTAHEASFDLRCNLCQFESKEVRKYNKHMKEHFPGPPFNCDYPRCTYSSEKIQPMLTHRAVHSDERPYTCHCGMRFRTNNTLIAHKKVHLGKKEYTCPDCGISFATKNTLSQHSVKHSDMRPYLCDLCGFSTKFQSHLIAHKRIHTGEVFKCQFPNCSYFTPKRSQLKAHMRAHLGIRAHVCEVCGKTFIERSHLVRHEKLHTDSRLQCEKCEYSTTRKDKLKDHIKKHHSGAAALKPVKKAKMISTSKSKKSAANDNDSIIKEDESLEVNTPLMVKWDHGSYSLAQDSQDSPIQEGDTEPLLNTEGDYCVLREQLGTGEPMQQILTIDQINGSISVAKALDTSNIVVQAASPIVNSEASLQNQAVTVISSSVPCLNIVSSPDHINSVVNGSIVSSGAETTDQNSQTYTIIQTPAGTATQQEYGGLSAFMALF